MLGNMFTMAVFADTVVPVGKTLLPQVTALNQQSTAAIPMIANANHSWPDILAQSAVVMDLSTGTVVYAKDPLKSEYPASITKIMTAIVAMQHGKLTDELVASQNAVSQPSDKLYMLPGEAHTLHELLGALMLDSANDAAVEIAEAYGGSVAGFATMMNQEAVQLGAKHTHFTNPNGLPDQNHVTTSYDMAVITRAAMQIPEISQIVQTKMIHWQGAAWQSDLWNLNRMLFYYPGATGVKTGYTSIAHETLVVTATRGSQSFVAVLMNTPTDYEIRHDASALLDFAFAHYETETVLPQGIVVGQMTNSRGETISLITPQSVQATVEKESLINYTSRLIVKAPHSEVKRGTVVGNLIFSSGGIIVGQTPIELNRDWQIASVVQNRTTQWFIGGGIGVLFTIGFILFMWRNTRRQKSKLHAEHFDY